MVNGINSNQRINSYVNNSGKTTSKSNAETPAFLLRDDEKGVVWERSSAEEDKKKEIDKKAVRKADERNIQQTQSAVNRTKLSKEENADIKPDVANGSGTLTLEGILTGVKNLFQNIFNFIWYGNTEEIENEKNKDHNSIDGVSNAKIMDASEKEATLIESENGKNALSEEQSLQVKDQMIRELIAKHDTEGVVDILTNHYTIQPARNSNLLTYYNRHGQIVNMSNTNTGRILRGDRNTTTL